MLTINITTVAAAVFFILSHALTTAIKWVPKGGIPIPRGGIGEMHIYNNKARMLTFDIGDAYRALMSGAIRDTATPTRMVMRKKGNFQDAVKEFEAFAPTNIHSFDNKKGIYGFSGKIAGNSDVHDSKGIFDNTQLNIIVRSWSSSPPHYPTLEIFPDAGLRRGRSYGLKMRYVDD